MIGKRTILVVEDNELSRLLLVEQLEGQYNVLSAGDGQVGLEILRENYERISLILLDIDMPVMDGYQFLEIVKSEKALKHIPVIVTTSNDNAEAEERCLELGAADFLGKPFDPRRAFSRIRNTIRVRETTLALREMERDDLTNLYNKKGFLRRAENRIQEEESEFGIVALDIENFKLSNTLYGEEKCDEYLKFLGDVIAGAGKEIIAGRFSGDQFVILFHLTETLKQNPTSFIHREWLEDAPIPHQIVKIGIYAPIDKNIPMVRCCDRAFVAIRQIKGVYGENVAFYNENMTQRLMEDQRILDCMEAALEQEQFTVYYQPKHDSLTGKIAGAEALVRWIHPDLGFMNPGQFIPLFEKNGFITELDSFVMKRVCKDIKKWESQNLPVVPVSVNVSRRGLLEQGWMEKQLDMIDEMGIAHNLVHMEVTESMYAENTEIITKQVKMVQARGFIIEMDDFGSGYSSLGMLASCPLDVIKLDISFVRQIDTYEIVIENVIKLAHRMGFKTVAEGAETEKQFLILRRMGCDFIQGYYFSRPLPVAEYEKYLVDHNLATFGDGQDAVLGKKWDDITAEQEIKNTLLECIEAYVSPEDGAKRINKLLSIIGRFYGADRSYIFEHNLSENTTDNTYEWCNEGIAAEMDHLQGIDMSLITGWNEAFKAKNEFFLPSVDAIKDTERDLYDVLKPQGINSLLTAAIQRKGELIGFMGVDNPTVHTDTLDLLHSVISFISNELVK